MKIKQGNIETLYYSETDHPGSIVGLHNIGFIYGEKYSYDAWGRMRNPSTWVNYAPGSESSLFIAGRGFTGHEHLP